MTERLFRVGETSWYVLVDIEKQEILDQYEKSATQATADQIESQLADYPDPSVIEEDIQALIWLVNNFEGVTQERKDRVKALIQSMYLAYQDEPELLERAELRARLDKLQSLLAQME